MAKNLKKVTSTRNLEKIIYTSHLHRSIGMVLGTWIENALIPLNPILRKLKKKISYFPPNLTLNLKFGMWVPHSTLHNFSRRKLTLDLSKERDEKLKLQYSYIFREMMEIGLYKYII